MAQPKLPKIKKWFKLAFGREQREDSAYFNIWLTRFRDSDGPRYVWAKSDIKRRKALKKIFPGKFKGLKLGTNLYNKEYDVPKYTKW